MDGFEATKATVRRSGSNIHYWLGGSEDGPLVAFTPGALMDHRMFDEQSHAAARAGYRTLVWDVRGHGLSKPIGDEFSVVSVAEDLLALIESLGYEKAVLVGQSFGGYVSQELYFRRPDLVSAIVVIGSTCITVLPSRLEMLALKLSPLLFKLWPDGNLGKLIAKNTATKLEAQRYAHDASRMLSKEEFLIVWRAVANGLHEEPGHRIERPFLLTHGEHDKTGNIAREAPKWAKREPDCWYEVIPDAATPTRTTLTSSTKSSSASLKIVYPSNKPGTKRDEPRKVRPVSVRAPAGRLDFYCGERASLVF